MRKPGFFLLLSVTTCLAGCTGSTGPSGPSGPAGSGVQTYNVTFQEGVSPNSSFTGTTMNSLEAGAPTTSYPNNGIVGLANPPSGNARMVLSFPISNFIPQNATVVAAALQLYYINSSSSFYNPGTQAIGVHDMGITAMASCAWTTGATWNSYDGSNPWGNCAGPGPFTFGVNFNATPMSTVMLNAVTSPNALYAWTLSPSVVQKWITGPSDGVALACENENSAPSGEYADFIFGAPNNGSPFVRPQLVIQYTIP
jgi:hypothetical protein